MEKDLKIKGGDDACPQLLDLIPIESDWRDGRRGEERWKRGEFGGLRAEEEKDLDLRLGLPGDKVEKSSSVNSLGFFTKSSRSIRTNCHSGAKRGFLYTIENPNEDLKKREHGGSFQLHNKATLEKELSMLTSGKVELQQKSLDIKAAHVAVVNADSGGNNNSEARTASTRVVGWPPIRSYRKNLAVSSSKPPVVPPKNTECIAKTEETQKGLLVKINMDGIPIGRKVDLKSFNGYNMLFSAVEDLFHGLIAAQMDPINSKAQDREKKQVFAGLLDETGQYTLVYEDNEGDKMLVGDVPWNMFISTARRLRVIRNSDLSTHCLNDRKSRTAADR